MSKIGPKPIDRILRNRGGKTVDEIVVHGCIVHVEQMSDNCYWIGINKDDAWLSMNFHTERAPISFTVQEEEEWSWDQDKTHL